MNYNETVKILSLMKVAYPQMASKFSQADVKAQAQLWASLFQKTPYEAVSAALQRFIRKDSSGFAPSPGQIFSCIEQESPYPPPEEAWDEVYSLLSNPNEQIRLKWAYLPFPAQKAIGGINTLMSWKNVSKDELAVFTRVSFIKAYKEYAEIEQNTGNQNLKTPAIEFHPPRKEPEDWRYKSWESMTEQERIDFKQLPTNQRVCILQGLPIPEDENDSRKD